MYEWLEEELEMVRTPRFHVVDGPADDRLRSAIVDSGLNLPSAYKSFVLKFGNAKLYRSSRQGYRLHVLAGPRLRTLLGRLEVFEIASNDGALVCVPATAAAENEQILEYESSGLDETGQDFSTWLKKQCDRAKQSFGRERWEEILKGPTPFSPRELEVLQWRREFHWRDIGLDRDSDRIIEITNNSRGVLPIFAVGVRSKDRRLNGEVWFNTAELQPGETRMFHHQCYKDLVPPQEIELFSVPEPQPEDREYVRELRNRGLD